jgi:biotin carboxylase
MTTIMILGAGIMQIPGIRLAKRSGWKVIVADGNKDALGRTLADHFEVVDLKDREGLLGIARRYHDLFGLDGVFTAGTDFSSSVAWVAEKMGLPGISFETAMRATDKCLMRQAFQKAGVPSPRFACVSGCADALSVLGGMDFPLVVKPVDNMGARGVRRVDSREALVEAIRSALPLSRSSRVIVEEYMEGPELSLDAIVYRGTVTICGNADRHICFPPNFVEMGHTIPTCLDGATKARIEEIFRAGICAIGIDNGVAKGDIKLTPRGPMVGEIAARLSGGYMSGWTFPLSSGVEVTQAAMNVAVGLPPGDLSPRLHKVVAERAFISIPGIVARIAGEQEARGLPGIAEVFTRAAVGNPVVFPTNNVEKCGNVLAVADTRDAAVQTARAALGCLFIHLEPLQDGTTRYLFGGSGHDAFDISDPAVRSGLEGMPSFQGDPVDFEPEQPVPILLLPGLSRLSCRDWHGLLPDEAVKLAVDGAGVLVDGKDKLAISAGTHAGFMLSGLFWKAIIRGSAQGGRYLIDSVREASRRGILERFLAGL